jgi:hypothetical protein
MPYLQQVFKVSFLRFILENVSDDQVVFHADVAPKEKKQQAVFYCHEDVPQADVLNFFVDFPEKEFFYYVVCQNTKKSDKMEEWRRKRQIETREKKHLNEIG